MCSIYVVDVGFLAIFQNVLDIRCRRRFFGNFAQLWYHEGIWCVKVNQEFLSTRLAVFFHCDG
jgi:hypothetical protein